MRLMIVTGGDEAYAPFVADLALSLNQCRKKLTFAMGCLDYGLLPETRERLKKQFDTIAKPAWPFRPHAQFDNQIQARAFATRPFLPDLFPGYDAYAWIDADSVVQDLRALVLLATSCGNGLAGVVPTVDRSYRHQSQNVEWVFERNRMAFGADTARQMMNSPYIASGVVAASAASPLWKKWQSRFQVALDRWDGPRLCDQAVLNHVVYFEDLPHHKLPSFCNWICHLALPFADVKRGALVEPSYPFDPIYIVANSFNDKRMTRKIPRLDGGHIEAALTFAGLRHAMIASRAP
ncbi:MAG: hypothetical protein K8S25_17480 [Alphaproteobacteria bacterium]|nr:hypothetical protein [Alphaproteobacteria bacterium]